jgi:putative transposase
VIFCPQERRTFFVTTVTANRRPLFKINANAALLLDVFRDYREQGRFTLHAFVVMPDHLHVLLTPAPDISLEKAIQLIKGGFSFRLKDKLPVWQRSFKEVLISTPEKLDAFRKYAEENPVRAGLSTCVANYPHSSANFLEGIDPVPRHLRRDAIKMAGAEARPLNPAGFQEPEDPCSLRFS